MSLICNIPLKVDLKDISKNNLNVKYIKSSENPVPYFQTAFGRSGLAFDGFGSYVVCENDFIFTPRTISVWIHPFGTMMERPMFILSGSDGIEKFELHTQADKSLRFIMSHVENSAAIPDDLYFDTPADKIVLSRWNHICLILKKSNRLNAEEVSIYINNIYVGRKVFPSSKDWLSLERYKLVLGNRCDGIPTPTYNFDGLISDLSVYNHPVHESMVSKLYSKSTSLPIEDNIICEYYLDKQLTSTDGISLPLIPVNSTFEEDEEVGHHLSINYNKYAVVKEMFNFMRYKKFSISLWMKLPKHDLSNSVRENILSFQPGAVGSFHLLFTNNSFHFASWNSSTCGGPGSYTDVQVDRDVLENWTHVICEVDNEFKLYRIYINGKLFKSINFDNNQWMIKNDTIEMWLGGSPAAISESGNMPSRSFYIKHIKISTDTIEYDEVKNIKNYRYKNSSPILHLPLNGNSDNITKYGFKYTGNTEYSTDSILGQSMFGPVSTNTSVLSRSKYLLSLMEREFSMMFWYKEALPIESGKINPIFGITQHGGAQHGYFINIDFETSNMFIKLHYIDKTKKDITIPKEVIGDTKKWHHYTLTYSGNTLKLYVDSVKVYSVNLGSLTRLEHNGILENVRIGGFNTDAYYNTPNSFMLNDFRVYNYVVDRTFIERITMANILDFKVDATSEFQKEVLGPQIYDLGAYIDLENTGLKHPGALFPTHGWSSGYNGGVPSPSEGYHAYWNRIEGDMTIVFKHKNSEAGLAGRWLGVSNGMTSFTLKKNEKVTISFDMKETVDLNHLTRAGFYHSLDDNPNRSFYSGEGNVSCTELNKWERKTITLTMHEKFNELSWCDLYIYGNFGSEGISYVKNIKVEIGDHGTPYSKKIITQDKNLLPTSPLEFYVDSSGYARIGTYHKRLDGSFYVKDVDSNTRFRVDLPGKLKFKPLTRYTASVDVFDIDSINDSNKIISTLRFQIQYYQGPSQSTNNVIWSDKTDLTSGSNSKIKSVIKLDNGWHRIIFSFSFIPPLTDNDIHSVIYFQGGADYEGYSRTYFIKNFKLVQGVGDPNMLKSPLEDNSIYCNAGTTENLNPLVKNEILHLNTENYTKFERLKFDKLNPTSSFTYYIKFKATKIPPEYIFHFIGFSRGSQMDGLIISRDGTIFFNMFSYLNPNIETRVSLDGKIEFNKWEEVCVSYNNETEKIKLYINGELKSTKTISLTPFVNTQNMFGVNCGSSADNYPNRLFDGYVERIAFFGRALSVDKVYNYLDLKLKISKSNDIYTNKILDYRYRGNKTSIGGLLGTHHRITIDKLMFFKIVDTETTPSRLPTFRLNLGIDPFQKGLIANGSNSTISILLECVTDASWVDIVRITDVNDRNDFNYTVYGKFIHITFSVSYFNDIYNFLDFEMSGCSRATVGIKLHRFYINGIEHDFSCLTDEKIVYRNTNLLNYRYLQPLAGYSSRDWKLQDWHIVANHNKMVLEQNPQCEWDLMFGNSFADGNFEAGFDYDSVEGHTNNVYRFSIFIRRPVYISGHEYLGTNGRRLISSEGGTENLYFAHPNFQVLESSGIKSDWHLYIFYIIKNSDAFTFKGDHGIYLLDADLNLSRLNKLNDPAIGSELYNGEGNMKFTTVDEFVDFSCRSYLYYCGDSKDSCRFYRPRVDVCDGTEPSIAELILGLDHDVLPFINDQHKILNETKIKKYFNIASANNIVPIQK